jgi:hypothetical protein
MLRLDYFKACFKGGGSLKTLTIDKFQYIN